MGVVASVARLAQVLVMGTSEAHEQTEDEVPSIEPKFPSPGSALPHGRLRRLRIDRFRNVKPGTELHFDDGLNILLGRNGTGKTTLLELVSAICRSDLGAFEQEDFKFEYDITFGTASLLIRVSNISTSSSSIPAPLTHKDRSRSWQYQFAMAIEGAPVLNADVTTSNGTATWVASGTQTVLQDVSLFTPAFIVIAINKCERAPLLPDAKLAITTALLLGQGLLFNSCVRLDEGLDLFRFLVGGHALSSMHRGCMLSLYSNETARESFEGALEVLSRSLSQVYVPLSLSVYSINHVLPDKQQNDITFRADKIEFLKELATVLDVDNVQLTMQLIERTVEDGVTRSTFGKPVFRITTHGGTTFSHERLSYGEKRLLAFMYHAAASSEILVADELVNGLHYEWIATCLDAIQGQAFLSSQNPLLLDHLPFTSAKEAERRFVLCSADDEGTWTWRNMDPDEAGGFFRAYEVGIQHVGEILRTKGLW